MKEGMNTLKEILNLGLLEQVGEGLGGSVVTWWKAKPALLYKCDVYQCYSPKLLARIGGNYLFIDEQGDEDSCYIQAASGNIYCLTIVHLEY